MLVGAGGALSLAIILLSSTDSDSIASKASSPTNFASMSTEEHLQKATVLVEQVEELVNKIKTSADLALCERKLNEAKKHLDEMPTSYTVSSAQETYTRPSKRRSKRRYTEQTVYYSQSVSSDRNEQLASIRSRFDQLHANVTALKAQQVRNSSLIKAAQEFALTAAKAGQNPPHSAATWQGIESLWQKAIDRLEEIPVESPNYIQAQKLLATYQANLKTVHARWQAQQESVEAFERAQAYIKSLLANTPADAASLDRSYTIGQLQAIINELKNVQHGTTAHMEAKHLLQSAQNKLKQLQS